ncbi:o-succinylbenzoate--CoA ligase [Cryobacterium tepidiphilum]|uniref:O-succinylbenzoate--CoA ligase n=1 Tax=Cryobacterium tepidiphilum TaxID=2486026 RepID=A0A3M8L9L8_9MICO|nr:o-succinylbenzoate--CoA ligase [Cryobacterium tepidiphilum]
MPRAVAVVIETSGSTDAPKRVMLSTDALLASAAGSNAALGGPGQWLLALPGHYIAGVQVLVRSIAAGTTPVIMPPGHFDPAAFAPAAEKLAEPVRYTSLVPVQLARLVDAAADDARLRRALRRFDAILVGGQALEPELLAQAERLDLRVVRTYGSSETAGGCVYDGVPIGNAAVRARPVDGVDQLEISGSMLALGYLGDDDRTDSRFIDEHGERWYRTGDLGEVDGSGHVRVLGRADNVIISGGEKVSLDAVERVVRSLPGLAAAVVVPADDPVWGQVPVVVVDEGEGRPALAAVRAAVASVLGAPARPARIVSVQRMPMLASGKPDRRALRRLGAGS